VERVTFPLHPAATGDSRRTAPTEAKGGPTFTQRFRDALVEANRSIQEAERSAKAMTEGRADVVETVIALSHAELSLRHLVALRNRVFEAYQEIMRLQL
jgi:flagellar hook-basal body complex protein FliE